jgi:nucleoid-associated protein YgaU
MKSYLVYMKSGLKNIFILVLFMSSSCTLFDSKSDAEDLSSNDSSEEIFQNVGTETNSETTNLADQADGTKKNEEDFFGTTAEQKSSLEPKMDTPESTPVVKDAVTKVGPVISIADGKKEEKKTKGIKSPSLKIASSPSKLELSDEVKTYTAGKDETLMWISFKLYGDYRYWRVLSKMNGGMINLKKNAGIKYKVPVNEFIWEPKGSPYLIKRGDTLGRISTNIYGIVSKWRAIYENNKEMIRDPNLIFAGFTLYYLKDAKLAEDEE